MPKTKSLSFLAGIFLCVLRRMTGHGFRSVASSWLNENGFNRDAVEMQLSHKEADKTREAYNRAKYLDERRAMMDAWGAYVWGLLPKE